MKIRDLRRPHGYFDDVDGYGAVGTTAYEVIDQQLPDRIDTGLLDAAGNPIYRRRPCVKFGFVP